MAFEQISRGARRWDVSALPDQITAHTESADGRTAGYLHVKLFDEETGKDIEFLVPDLPGEWTSTLADDNRTDRLTFFRAASVLWLFVDGRQLMATDKRGLAVHRAELVIQRAAVLFGSDAKPPLVLVVTHKDEGDPNRPSIDTILACAMDTGFVTEVIEVASFSKAPDAVVPGTGLSELIKTLRANVGEGPQALAENRRLGARSMMNFRNA